MLTLGALAELESAFGAADMLALAERFQSGRLSATDATKIIGAGLRAAGHALTDDDVGRMRTPDGAAGYVSIVARLLAATFGGPARSRHRRASAIDARSLDMRSTPRARSRSSRTRHCTARDIPFPGPR